MWQVVIHNFPEIEFPNLGNLNSTSYSTPISSRSPSKLQDMVDLSGTPEGSNSNFGNDFFWFSVEVISPPILLI